MQFDEASYSKFISIILLINEGYYDFNLTVLLLIKLYLHYLYFYVILAAFIILGRLFKKQVIIFH